MKVAFAISNDRLNPHHGYGNRIWNPLYRELQKIVDLTGYAPYLTTDPRCLNALPWDCREDSIPVENYDAILNIGAVRINKTNRVVNYDTGPYGQTKNVVCISKLEADTARSGRAGYAHRNPKVIYYGTDIEYFHPAETKEDYFVFFARIHPSKGAVMAFELAKRTGQKLKLIGEDKAQIFGSGATAEGHYKWIEEFKMECSKYSNVQYIGSVSDEEAIDILGRAKASLYPIQGSFQFDQTVIETLSCGTPVLVSSIPAPCELVDEGVTGFILPQYDLEAWAAAISRVNELDPHKVRQVAETKWSAKRMAQEFVPLLEMVARGETW